MPPHETDEPDRIMVDTGPRDDGYRVVGDLKRKKCPRCGAAHFSSWQTDLCVECFVISDAETKAGRPLTKAEQLQALRETGLE